MVNFFFGFSFISTFPTRFFVLKREICAASLFGNNEKLYSLSQSSCVKWPNVRITEIIARLKELCKAGKCFKPGKTFIFAVEIQKQSFTTRTRRKREKSWHFSDIVGKAAELHHTEFFSFAVSLCGRKKSNWKVFFFSSFCDAMWMIWMRWIFEVAGKESKLKPQKESKLSL